mmetsp:Transcript_15299/g.26489  ORF Transcript_15299/g.26489 Transcript_15299/m.26489 type:complete len:1035 (+) Transcript_15299:185-3289(+)|eukprot:CAMPEP_0119108546 /NCGR_PEP_ID=MMETSP1180-20130426/15036_1 /TAXON_ID=3052 ORGANISM="Chlamydomonas cf sp, Strain CCMP681" /NCGR_SAMPLE_ID=MMETSP1180 /ASSEMBLY_ACC=CAM_ASM_000741 /LENGTH=1034 /DNA_ID=CAMNT_0007094171 /DNA_START=159 /DNA_END=3263 /DNA_ORIENTATION=+
MSELQQITDLFAKLSTGATLEDRSATAAEVVALVKASGLPVLASAGVTDKLKAAMEDQASPLAREGALQTFTALVEAFGVLAEPFIISLLPILLVLVADKAAPVRTAADAALVAFIAALHPYSVEAVLPVLFEGMGTARNWQTKVGSLNALRSLAKVAPRQVAYCLPDIVPRMTESFSDAKQQVKDAAQTATESCFLVSGNRDIEKFVPALVSCIARPAETADCIHKLAATTFVQQVEAAPLSIMVPLLVRGLRERATAIKRKACVIIDNMAKLVDLPWDAAPFLPKLIPELDKVKEEVADPECRKVATGAHATLLRVGGEGKATAPPRCTAELAGEMLAETLPKASGALNSTTYGYVVSRVQQLVDLRHFQFEDWNNALLPFLEGPCGKEAVMKASQTMALKSEDSYAKAKCAQDVDLDEGLPDLCNCEFSLAYGAKILLNNARLRLKRGKRYGLCGPNGAGKTTLMRAIVNGQVEGFPPSSQLKTVYVEHDIDGSVADLVPEEFIFTDPVFKGIPKSEITQQLRDVGFNDDLLGKGVAALSGGWKMKLSLVRAMLQKADILLLDEPTNHLDVTNVAWLQNYLVSLTNVTSVLVSHDSSFLDFVCSHILHYENRKLRTYKGNLSEFVKQKPEARSYYQLSESPISFKFPEPGYLEGVKTKDKAILKMVKVGFAYPGPDGKPAAKQTLTGVSIYITLSSRVAVLGANGAGKSTMIKLLTGEMECQDGTVWKHPNLRIAYVAQHAFHHIEQMLDKTANQYIQWRYAIGEDREALTKVDRIITDEERKKMNQQFMVEGVKRVVEKILSRRKLKSSYEYEIKWINLAEDKNTYIPRDELIDMGFEKMVVEVDAKEAAAQGLMAKPLTQKNIMNHLEDFGLEPEFSTHSLMRGLSGGQKVKVVLGAAMWNNPHILVLDEPTNYLDRDSLGALAEAIKAFGGGVVMITHNREFYTALTQETWLVADGKLIPTGQTNAAAARELAKFEVQDEVTDAYGNIIKVKAPTRLKMSNKEKKANEKLRKARKERGEEVTDSEEDA